MLYQITFVGYGRVSFVNCKFESGDGYEMEMTEVYHQDIKLYLFPTQNCEQNDVFQFYRNVRIKELIQKFFAKLNVGIIVKREKVHGYQVSNDEVAVQLKIQ